MSRNTSSSAPCASYACAAATGIPGVAQVDELDALDHASIHHVETWDEPLASAWPSAHFGERLAEVHGAAVERAPDDDAGQARHGRQSCRMSSSDPTPPDAKTGMPAARATVAVLSEFGPAFHAVRGDVRVDRSPPRLPRRRPGPARSRRGRGRRVQPSTATRPSDGVHTDDDAVLEATAHLARETRDRARRGCRRSTQRAPASSTASTCAISRRPPPTCDGNRERPDDRRRTTAVWAGRPSKAPSRSTTCRRVAPAACHCRAIATGSSREHRFRLGAPLAQANTPSRP